MLELNKTYDWLHGDSVRIGKLIKIESTRVLIEGFNSTYWMKRKVFVKKIITDRREVYGIN